MENLVLELPKDWEPMVLNTDGEPVSACEWLERWNRVLDYFQQGNYCPEKDAPNAWKLEPILRYGAWEGWEGDWNWTEWGIDPETGIVYSYTNGT